ncbi:MAG: DUF892 family protein [Terriglobales bacterium]
MTEELPELKALLIEEMENLLHAENQLAKALPKLAKAAHAAQLRQCLSDHLEQTRGHTERLHQAFSLLGVKAKPKTSKGMQGLLEEVEERVREERNLDPASADLGLILAAQKLEHYEITANGSLRTLAERIGESRVARLLAENQAEDRRADQLLTEIALPLFARAA